MKLLIINGPNLNMLGVREPELYGRETYEQLTKRIERHCMDNNIEVKIFQSNHEGALVDAIQGAYFDRTDGIVINPGAYTHTSIAILDALLAVNIPTVEVHISNPDTREDFRGLNFTRRACVHTVSGHGTDGYLEAIDYLIENFYLMTDNT